METMLRPEFPRPDRQRAEWLNLNGSWDFALFAKGRETEEASFSASRNDYPMQINVPFSWTSPLSGIEQDVPGIGWYRKRVSYPITSDKRVFLCFGAVDYLTDVYINGIHAGHHQGGYSPFEIDVTEKWENTGNVIEVRAEDYRLETQTYGKQGYGEIQGIWQTVWLEFRPVSYIRNFRITTLCSGVITINASVSANDGACLTAEFDNHTYSAQVIDSNGKLRFTIDNPRLWSPDSPELYEGFITLTDGNSVDRVGTYFGIREITAETYGKNSFRWIHLNHRPVFLNGTLDQAFNPDGYFTYPTDKDMFDEAWRLKRLGLNMVRIHIKTEDPRKLYWLDKVGIMVMQDIPCFWGEPDQAARDAYENELPALLERDINHPSIYAWVVFNESWGLLTQTQPNPDPSADTRVYLPETQEWVRSIYQKVKKIDSTRLVEDNSPCRYDHVETDINTWHFYINGYEPVREHIRSVVENTFPGSSFNYIGNNKQSDSPLMNSECGLVWGVDESAGDSDLAWHYHYMINEYRLHDKICGFIFTEFHDVVNEFNGYYRIDNSDKDWGYEDFCRGMTLHDLHAPDFIATDCPPCRTGQSGSQVTTPIYLSSFSDKYQNEGLVLRWELWHDGIEGRVLDDSGAFEVDHFSYGVTVLPPVNVTLPQENAVAILSFYLSNHNGEILSRNFTTFDVQAPLPANQIEIPVTNGIASGFDLSWTAMGGKKLCLGGKGEITYHVTLPENWSQINGMVLYLEAGSKRILQKDCKITDKENVAHGFMRGYRVDRGSFKNSYWMTDETRFPSTVEVLINGLMITTVFLENDWADARGVLSWHAQPVDTLLDEAGSYGEEKRIEIPSRMVSQLITDRDFTLTLRVPSEGGLALYDREAGRYPHGILLKCW